MVFICSEPYPINSKYEHYFELFPYPLSDFQKWAIHAIVEGQHVLITAHTGSGKTLPAEFAILHFVGQGQKVIYTCPIKALSNQKYYEFSKKYPHISFGLMTGDIKTCPDADVVIMTTELVGSSFSTEPFEMCNGVNQITKIRDGVVGETVGFPTCLIFDEVHYINDRERGQVWEKAILSLPPHVQMVMLSATIDQPERFAKWCERGVDPLSPDYKQVYLASTNHRVVPLSHYGYLTTVESIYKSQSIDSTCKSRVHDSTCKSHCKSANNNKKTTLDIELEKEIRDSTNKMILLQNDKGVFQESGYRKIVKMQKIFEQKQVYMKRKHVLNNLANHLKEHDMLPAIGFVFSRKHVELCAHEITVPLLEFDSKIPYTVARECEQIVRKLPNFQEYLGLPEYQDLVKLLEKGIGIHHSGMIPILREIVELMISKKYIKLLFATESFAIGLDCPIKTAIFTGISKFDGYQMRPLLSHEYTQMAGRAGRRGIDTIGHVIHCNNLFETPIMNEYKAMLGGTPQTLISKFRISYPLVLDICSRYIDDTDTICVSSQSVDIETECFSKVSLEKSESVDSKFLDSSDISPKSNSLDFLTKLDSIDSSKVSSKVFQKKESKIIEFINKSMIFSEISKSIETQKKLLNKLDSEFLVKKELVEKSQLSKEKCLKYLDLETNLKTAVNKKRREIEKEIQSILDESKNCLNEIQSYNRFLELEERIVSEKEYLVCLESYIQINVEKVCDVLFAKGFIDRKTEQLTTLGKNALNIREIHPLISAKLIESTNSFQEFTTKQMVGFLSTLVDIKVPEDLRSSIPLTDVMIVSASVHSMIQLYNDYLEMEMRMDLSTGIQYEDALQFDIIDLAMEWTELSSYLECKIFIQKIQREKEISTGDFSKAMMKISAICRELAMIAEMNSNIEWLHKLSQVDGLILKYIATNQSLYI